jgi:hypothetical protein
MSKDREEGVRVQSNVTKINDIEAETIEIRLRVDELQERCRHVRIVKIDLNRADLNLGDQWVCLSQGFHRQPVHKRVVVTKTDETYGYIIEFGEEPTFQLTVRTDETNRLQIFRRPIRNGYVGCRSIDGQPRSYVRDGNVFYILSKSQSIINEEVFRDKHITNSWADTQSSIDRLLCEVGLLSTRLSGTDYQMKGTRLERVKTLLTKLKKICEQTVAKHEEIQRETPTAVNNYYTPSQRII